MKKTYRKHINIIVSFLFIASLLSQSFYGNGIVIKAEQRVEKTETEENRREIKSERTEYSTTYEVGDGKIETEIYPSEVRYVDKETGRLVDYDTSLKKVYRDETTLGTDIKDDYAFENERGDRKHYFPEKFDEETPVITEYKDYQFSMAPLVSDDIESSMEDIKEVENLYGNVSEKSNLVVYEDIKENMDIEIYSILMQDIMHHQ